MFLYKREENVCGKYEFLLGFDVKRVCCFLTSMIGKNVVILCPNTKSDKTMRSVYECITAVRKRQ